jgi:transposase
MTAKKTIKKPVKKTLNKNNKIRKNIKEPKKSGRDTLYNAKIHPLFANALSSQGLIESEIAIKMGISEKTITNWKNKYPEFLQAVNGGKKDYDSEQIENKLKELAKGYEFDSEQIVVVSDGSQIGSHWERVPIKKRVEPNLGAIKEWLWNRNPNRWKNKQLIELSNENNEPFIIEIK